MPHLRRLLLVAWTAGCTMSPPPPPTHTVVRGDTLSRIARDQGCTVDELRAWNGISGDRIEVGQVLVVGAAGAGAAPPPVAAPARKRRQGTRPQSTLSPGPEPASGAAPLVLPREQPCLAGPSAADEEGMEAGFAASAGLEPAAVQAALRSFEPNLLRCLTPGEPAAGTLELELTVGCGGRVSRVAKIDDGGLPPALVACVQETLRYVSFPPHDMPDGFTFGYPLTVGP